MKKILLFVYLALWSVSLIAQNFSGQASYSTSSSMTISFGSPEKGDSTQAQPKISISMNEQEELNRQIRASMQKEYELQFNTHSSLYKEVPKMKTMVEEQGIEVMGLGGGTEGGLYKNTRDKSYAESRDIFGKLFLVEDNLIKWDWQLKGESKKIGQYTCYKATAIKSTKSIRMVEKDGEEQPVEQVKEVTIEAWYTPEIPIIQGPGEYWGLPGFILEVRDDKLHIVCSQISVQTEELTEVEKPHKGKKVDRNTFEQIYQEKVQEMVEAYDDQRQKNKS